MENCSFKRGPTGLELRVSLASVTSQQMRTVRSASGQTSKLAVGDEAFVSAGPASVGYARKGDRAVSVWFAPESSLKGAKTMTAWLTMLLDASASHTVVPSSGEALCAPGLEAATAALGTPLFIRGKEVPEEQGISCTWVSKSGELRVNSQSSSGERPLSTEYNGASWVKNVGKKATWEMSFWNFLRVDASDSVRVYVQVDAKTKSAKADAIALYKAMEPTILQAAKA